MIGAANLLELMKQREQMIGDNARTLGPLMVFDNSETLPQTPREVIERASALGRPVIQVSFVESDGDGRPASGQAL